MQVCKGLKHEPGTTCMRNKMRNNPLTLALSSFTLSYCVMCFLVGRFEMKPLKEAILAELSYCEREGIIVRGKYSRKLAYYFRMRY